MPARENGDVFTAPATLLIGNHLMMNTRCWHGRFVQTFDRIAPGRPTTRKDIDPRRQATTFTQIPEGSAGTGRIPPETTVVADALGSTKELWTTLRENSADQNRTSSSFSLAKSQQTTSPAVLAFGSSLWAPNSSACDYWTPAAPDGRIPTACNYYPIALNREFHEEVTFPHGRFYLPGMIEQPASNFLKALYVIGSNPVGRLNLDPFVFSNTFVVVQDMFLTVAVMAYVVLPAGTPTKRHIHH